MLQMFPRPGIYRDYPEGEKDILFGNNVELPKVLNSMTMIYLINGVRADIFPVQTEQTRNTYYIAFQIIKKLQAINTECAHSFTRICIQRINCCSPQFPSF